MIKPHDFKFKEQTASGLASPHWICVRCGGWTTSDFSQIYGERVCFSKFVGIGFTGRVFEDCDEACAYLVIAE